MTVASETRSATYLADGATRVWPFGSAAAPLRFYEQSQIRLWVRASGTAEWGQISSSLYDITDLVGNPADGYTSCNLTYPREGTAPLAAPYEVYISIYVPLVQTGLDLRLSSGFDPRAVEKSFDLVVRMIQQTRDEAAGAPDLSFLNSANVTPTGADKPSTLADLIAAGLPASFFTTWPTADSRAKVAEHIRYCQTVGRAAEFDEPLTINSADASSKAIWLNTSDDPLVIRMGPNGKFIAGAGLASLNTVSGAQFFRFESPLGASGEFHVTLEDVKIDAALLPRATTGVTLLSFGPRCGVILERPRLIHGVPAFAQDPADSNRWSIINANCGGDEAIFIKDPVFARINQPYIVGSPDAAIYVSGNDDNTPAATDFMDVEITGGYFYRCGVAVTAKRWARGLRWQGGLVYQCVGAYQAGATSQNNTSLTANGSNTGKGVMIDHVEMRQTQGVPIRLRDTNNDIVGQNVRIIDWGHLIHDGTTRTLDTSTNQIGGVTMEGVTGARIEAHVSAELWPSFLNAPGVLVEAWVRPTTPVTTRVNSDCNDIQVTVRNLVNGVTLSADTADNTVRVQTAGTVTTPISDSGSNNTAVEGGSNTLRVTPTGGTVAVTLADKAGQILDAADRGASPSATAGTNVAAINGALDYLGGLGGGTLRITKPGVYLVGQSNPSPTGWNDRRCIWLRYDNLTLEVGQGVTLKVADAADAHLIAIGSRSGTTVTVTNSGVTGAGTLDGNRANQSAPTPTTEHWQVVDVSTGCTQAFITGKDGAWLKLINAQWYGIGFQLGTFTNCTIRYVIVDGAYSDGIDCKDASNLSSGNVIENVVVRNFGLGLGIDATDFVGYTPAGIDLREGWHVADCTVIAHLNNTICFRFQQADPAGGADLTVPLDFTTATDCRAAVSGTPTGVIGFRRVAPYVVMTSCVASGVADGAWLSGFAGYADVTAIACGTGVRIQQSASSTDVPNGMVVQARVHNALGNGVVVDDSCVNVVLRPTVTGCAAYGVLIEGGATGTHIPEGTVTGNSSGQINNGAGGSTTIGAGVRQS